MSRAKSGENKKKPARVAAGPEAPGFARSLGENIGRFIRPLIPLFIFFVVGGGFSALLWRSFGVVSAAGQGIVADSSGYRLTDKALRTAVLQKQRPVWISREDYEQVAALGLFAVNHSIFEPNLSSTLAMRYKSSPWIDDVKEVRLRYPAQVEVEFEWRRPAARVDKSMVLDSKGWVLNLMPDNQVVRDVPLITNVICNRTETGKLVREKELMEGLGLMSVVKEALSCSPGQLKITILQREPAGTWRVITDRGPAIHWGFFTDEPGMDEPRTQEKADLLRRRLCEIKDPSLLEYVKVYTAQAPVKPRSATPPLDATPVAPRTRH
jgi:hypothetical protein